MWKLLKWEFENWFWVCLYLKYFPRKSTNWYVCYAPDGFHWLNLYLNLLSAILGDFFCDRFYPHQVVCLYTAAIKINRPLRSKFGKNVLNESMALVANFGTNIEMSLHETKELPKGRYTSYLRSKANILLRNRVKNTYRVPEVAKQAFNAL